MKYGVCCVFTGIRYIQSVYAQWLMKEHGWLFFGDERAHAVMQA